MQLRYVLSLSLILPLMGQAQTQNALDLDGLNDEVTVANASALIANGTGYSLTCWVYPTQSTNWPNMDAYAGFRDNAVCDFYLLQTYGTTLEGRFRNSSNGIYTLASTGSMVLNVWQFVALTYDGSMLRMYHNGTAVDSVVANGIITTNSGMFRIGNMPIPGSTQIFMDGQVDETTLWKRGLTAAEIQCIMNYGALPSDPDLKLYYKMDQGTAGGANAGLTTLIDASGHLNGAVTGFTLNGVTSNYVDGCPIAGTAAATICPGETYTFNGQALAQAGTYTTGYPMGNSCDSLATLTLQVTTVNTTVVQSNGNLISQAVGAQYQWLDCGNGFAEVPGATGPSYAVTVAGSYAVEVTQNGCVDTSACVSNVGVEELQALSHVVVRYDRSGDAFVITGAPAGAFATVFDTRGRAMSAGKLVRDRMEVSTAGLPDGIYLVRVLVDQGSRSFRVALTR
jgi:hypothetical protein